MRFIAKVVFAPFIAIVVLMGALDRAAGGRACRRIATASGWLSATSEGMTLGVLAAAIVSLLVILFSEALGVPARTLPLVAALPLVGGYIGAAAGFHLGGHDSGQADEG